MNKIYSWIAKIAIGRLLGENKTLILGWITSVIGIWNIIVTTETVEALCHSHNICLAGNAIFGYINLAIGEMIKVLRRW